jgi:hypothetical protein
VLSVLEIFARLATALVSVQNAKRMQNQLLTVNVRLGTIKQALPVLSVLVIFVKLVIAQDPVLNASPMQDQLLTVIV